MAPQHRFRGCLLGLACGDAVGTAVEFHRRGSFPPLTDMIGGAYFQLKPGQWTDDTSMALCLATSLTELNRFDPADQMRGYCKWVDEGYLSSNGRCLDVGNTVYDALERFRQTGEPFSGSTDPQSAGNGCIKRHNGAIPYSGPGIGNGPIPHQPAWKKPPTPWPPRLTRAWCVSNRPSSAAAVPRPSPTSMPGPSRTAWTRSWRSAAGRTITNAWPTAAWSAGFACGLAKTGSSRWTWAARLSSPTAATV